MEILYIILIVLLTGLLAVFGYRLTILYKSRSELTRQLAEKSATAESIATELHRLQESAPGKTVDKTHELQAEIKEHGKLDLSLKKALKRAEEANFLKNAFLSNISHEIRTPLNNIIGFSSLLEAEISLLENKELFDYARAISESGDRLLHLLNNIIDMSRIEANDMQLTLKPCNVNAIVGTATQLFIFKANEQKLKLNFIANEVPEALADEKSLTNVLSAIIENAVKYTEKGFVNISTEFLSEQDEVSIRIKDTGIGIDEAFLPTLFDPFRHDTTGYTKESQGAGLGLPLAKSLIELMQGHITIESDRGTGTVVTVFLKVQSTKQPKPSPKEIERKQKAKSMQGLDVFIVEDDLMNKMVLYEMTKRLGTVVSAANGDETLRVIENALSEGKVFDIMLFDINLPPPWDGTRLMHEIRKKWKEYKTIPFVAQTAYAMAGDKEKLLESGFDDYIAKPINQQELYSIIKNQLNKF